MSHNVVIGAGGKSGFQCTKQLASKGYKVRAVVRNPSKYAQEFSSIPSVDVIAGDVKEKTSMQTALQGAKGVIFAASRSVDKSQQSAEIDRDGLINVADVCKEVGVERLVVISSGLVDPKNSENEIRKMLNQNDGIMDAKYEGEEYVRKSGVPYCIIRPGGLVDEEGGQTELLLRQGDDAQPSRIARADVAALCVEALTAPDAVSTTFEVWWKPEGGEQQSDLAALFADLEKDKVAVQG